MCTSGAFRYFRPNSIYSLTLMNLLSVGTIAANSKFEESERARVAAYRMNYKRLTYRWTEAGKNASSIGAGLSALEGTPRIMKALDHTGR